MPQCSILITCFNLGAFIEEALESAFAQTHPDFEIVLIDDGSSDAATIAVLNQLPAHPQMRVLRTENQGVARARNFGILHATGKYILPLDADDRILPTYLARATAVLDAQPEVGFVGCHYRSFGERSTECRPRAYRFPEMLIENVVPVASLYRRECWETTGGYCPELNSIEDWDLWLGFLDSGWQGVVIPEILFEYRVRANSNISHLRKPEIYVERLNLLYQRHEELYIQYMDEILRGKNRQFAELHSWAMYLDEQARNWEKVAIERLSVIDSLNSKSGRKERWRYWRKRQGERWNRIRTTKATKSERVFFIIDGIQRVVQRRIQEIRNARW